VRAILKKDSPRYSAFLRLFRDDQVPVVDHDPDHYRIDLSALTLVQRARIIQTLSQHWRLTGEDVTRLVDGRTPKRPITIRRADVWVEADLGLTMTAGEGGDR
jgi:hypothetical protein